MHHKRGRASNQRAGCKMCKPWKVNGFATERKEGEKFSDHARREAAEIDFKAVVVEAFKEGLDFHIDRLVLHGSGTIDVNCSASV